MLYHAVQRQGALPTQEDAWCVTAPRGWFLGAVFDGHGGSVTASCATNVLPKKIEAKIRYLAPAQTLKESFEETSAEAERQTDDGAAALAVVMGQGQLHWANAGDCRLLLVTTRGYQQLTNKHRLDNPQELQRISRIGRAVIQPPYLYVGPNGLMPTRSLGDRNFKAAGVVATPEVGSRLLDVHDRLLVLATDGLWDVLDNDTVAEITRWHKTPKAIADALADAALQNGGTDNATVLVVDLTAK
jgi:protein phosphatase 1L